MNRNEKIKKYDDMLQKCIDKKEYVKIFRIIFDTEENLSGFILKMSKDFLLLQLDYEFMFDGYVIIRKDDFDSLRCNAYDKTQKKIFKAEGLLETGYGIKENINLTSWVTILNDLRRYDFHAIIENTHKDYLDFFIGPIKSVTKTTVTTHNYDPTAKLYDKLSSIKLESIKHIKFGDKYSTTFRKYLKQPESIK